MTNTDYLVYLW